ncbi:GGDEF domain-containing protein [Spirochaetia bacterium]|nr:GGDEF domain-containing protein [Spirochaetia bacterium]
MIAYLNMLVPGTFFLSLVRKLRYYGFSKEELDDCRGDILKHNASSLILLSLASAVLVVLLSLYPHENNTFRYFYYVAAALEFLVFLYVGLLAKINKCTPLKINFCFWVFIITLAVFSAFVYAFGQSIYAVRFLIFFLTFQIIYVFSTQVMLLMDLALIVAFLFINSYSEDLTGFHIITKGAFDVLNILFASIIATMFNWYISHVLIKDMLTSRSLVKERNLFLEDSIHDQLTGLNNRRSFDQSINFYTSVCRHVHQTVCVVMMDVDYFKFYNDFYGHPKGDIVLQSIGEVLKKIGKEENLYTARVGGEEFIIIWTENRIAEAERVVLKIRQMIIALNIPHEKSLVASYITASFGLYVMRGGSEDSSQELYDSADTALYEAKGAGRDCIMLLDSNDKSLRPVELRAPEEIVRR